MNGAGDWLLLAVGGVLGTWSRFALGGSIARRIAEGGAPTVVAGPIGTLTVNVVGCFVIGLIAALATSRPMIVSPDVRLLLAVGFCGAFTTFSSFSLETLSLLQAGRWDQALLYAGVSNVLGLVAVFAGWSVTRMA